MSGRQQSRLLPDGRRLHLQDGPIDLIIGADGAPAAVAAAYLAAEIRFATLLDELCAELALLRQPTGRDAESETARRMVDATRPYADRQFITPMAAVAGAGAGTILAAMCKAAPLTHAYVNNGGDIALHLAPGRSFTIGMIDRPDTAAIYGNVTLTYESGIHGIATSGRHGRSFSRGIADAVTVLAEDAAGADAAATMIANEVDLPGHPAITRVPARSLQPDSDLGARLVTRSVGDLNTAEIVDALARGVRYAEQLVERGRIHSAALHLAGATRLVGVTQAVMPGPSVDPIRPGISRQLKNQTQSIRIPGASPGITDGTGITKEWHNHAAG